MHLIVIKIMSVQIMFDGYKYGFNFLYAKKKKKIVYFFFRI